MRICHGYLISLLGMAACKADREPPDSGREDTVRNCILGHVQGQWEGEAQTLSGYLLVHAYLQCVEPLQPSQAPDFQSVCQGWVRIVPEDPSRLQLIPPLRPVP